MINFFELIKEIFNKDSNELVGLTSLSKAKVTVVEKKTNKKSDVKVSDLMKGISLK